ncbi:MAG TPA: septum formation initiator family protein [Candidatus Scybalocola faecavium]|nr:septum formation initiator family protein [Candidatus Scybalocola faecavium]
MARLEQNKSEKKKNKGSRSGMLMISGVVLIFCLILTYNSLGLRERIQENAGIVQDLQEQIDEQEKTQQELVQESEYINSDDYIEEIARDKLGLVHDNEIVFQKQDETSAQ